MKTRILTGLIGLAILLIMIFSPVYIFNIACIIISLMALYEVQKAAGISKILPLFLMNFAFAFMVVISLRISLLAVVGTLIAYLLSMFVLMIFNYDKVNISNVITSLFFMIYTVCLIHFIVLIREYTNGLHYLAVLLVGVFATDTFAYFSGVFLGKHKLCPHISPKKTIEGSVGGWLGCVIFLLITGAVFSFYKTPVNYINLLIFSIICGGLSQIGDLTASIIKRYYGIKDYGSLLPGHGGIMDRLDSVLLVAPVLYFFAVNLPII